MTSINLRRRTAAAASVVLVAVAGVSAMPASAAPGAATPTAAAPARSHTVTLLTGDRVTVSRPDASTARIEPARGREHLAFSTSVVHGHLFVVPGDAAP